MWVALAASADVLEPITVSGIEYLGDGDWLVTDAGQLQTTGTAGVYRIDSDGNITWRYTEGLRFSHNAVTMADGNIMISDSGNDRAIIVDESGTILWTTESIGFSDSHPLHYINDVNALGNGNVLLSDRDNHRVLEITPQGEIVWQFGVTDEAGSDDTHLDGPHNPDRLPNGNTIICDSGNDRILEVAPDKSIVWRYETGINWARDADRLPNGNTLIGDSSNGRVIEVNPAGETVWQINATPMVYDVDRLEDGTTAVGMPSGIYVFDESGQVSWSQPPMTLPDGQTDVRLPSPSTGVKDGRLAVRVYSPTVEGRYGEEGAPVLVLATGTLSAGSLANPFPKLVSDTIVVTYIAPGGKDSRLPLFSDGSFDSGGTASQAAIRDVLLFAAGDLTDSKGRSIHDVATVPVAEGNVGIIGRDYAGDIALATAAHHAEALSPYLKYIVQWESPASSQVGSLETNASIGFFIRAIRFPNPWYETYEYPILPISYSTLAWAENSLFFDGNGDGVYNTVTNPVAGMPATPDTNGDGVVGKTEDFPVAGLGVTEGFPARTVFFSRPLAQFLDESGFFGDAWPDSIASAEQTQEFWDLREGLAAFDGLTTHMPELMGMVAGQVQTNRYSHPAKLHIRQGFEAWSHSGRWVRINPGAQYLALADPELGERADLPYNVPNQPPGDWLDAAAYLIPNDIPAATAQAAAVWEMADRVQGRYAPAPCSAKSALWVLY